MIVREILTVAIPFDRFDWFNDAKDTRNFVLREPPSEARDSALRFLELGQSMYDLHGSRRRDLREMLPSRFSMCNGVLSIDNQNNRLLECRCGAVGVADPRLRICPDCKRPPMVNLVDCAHPDHNSEDGCGNPECFKYHGE